MPPAHGGQFRQDGPGRNNNMSKEDKGKESKGRRYLVGCYLIRGDMRKKIPNHLTMVEVVDGEKQTMNFVDPSMGFYFDKPGCPGEATPRMYVPIDDVDRMTAVYGRLPHAVAELSGRGKGWLSDMARAGRYRDAIFELQKHPSAHGTDVNVEDYFIGRYLDRYADEIIEAPALHKCHSDIELDIYTAEEFPDPELAECPIDLITIYSNQSNEMWTYALSVVDPPNPQIAELKADKGPFEQEVAERFSLNDYNIMFYDDELTMIRAYFKRVHALKPDFLGFWNMVSFDFKYMKNRIERLSGKSALNIMCPPSISDAEMRAGKVDPFPAADIDVYEDTRSHDFATMGSYVKVVGWTNWVDQLITFANLRATMGKRDSYSLDAIAEAELDEKDGRVTKDPVPVSLREFSRWDYRKYVMYNVQDVHLIHRIEMKTRDIDLIYRIAMTTRTRIHKAWRKTTSLRNMAEKFMRGKGYVISNNKNSGGDVKAHVKFDGAWVADPIMNEPLGVEIAASRPPPGATAEEREALRGRRQNAVFDSVADLDLASIYPSIIQALMIDPANQYHRISHIDDAGNEVGNRFTMDLISGDMIKFCAKWFDLPGKDYLIGCFGEWLGTPATDAEMPRGRALLSAWRLAAVSLVERALGRSMEKEELVALNRLAVGRFHDRRCRLSDSYANRTETAWMSEAVDFILKEKPIVSGNGTLFCREDRGGVNVTGSFIGELLTERKRVKKNMFAAQEAGNREEEDRLDMRQKVYKVLTNAFFGVIGQPSFIFNDVNSAPAITLTGQVIITTLVQHFEAFFGDNWGFECVADALDFVDAALEGERTPLRLERNVSTEDVLKRIKIRIPEGLDDEMGLVWPSVESKVRSLGVDDLRRLYYANNLFEFLEEDAMTDMTGELLEHDIPSGNVEDVEGTPAEVALSTLWDAVSDWVVMDRCFEDRMSFCEKSERRTVLVVDTDSTFILVDKFVKYVRRCFEWSPGPQEIVSACNTAIYLLSRLSPAILDGVSDRLNVEKDKQGFFSLKNEFLYKRLLITPNKKSYAGYLLQREGKTVTDPGDQLNIKNLDIKKVKTNIETRVYFQRVLKELILGMNPEGVDESGECLDIDLQQVVAEFARYEQMVRESLGRGEMTFSKPVKFSGRKAYQFPFRMEQFRGTLVWNDIHPEAPIHTLEYVNMFKCTAGTADKFDLIVEANDFSEEDLATLEVVKRACFSGEDMLRYGFTRICIPKTVANAPSWVLPFIDEPTIVEDNVKAALILLQCLGIRCVTVRGSSRFTNILEF